MPHRLIYHQVAKASPCPLRIAVSDSSLTTTGVTLLAHSPLHNEYLSGVFGSQLHQLKAILQCFVWLSIQFTANKYGSTGTVEVGKQGLGRLPQVPSIFHKVTSISIGERSRTRTTYSTAIDRAVFRARIIQCAFTEVSCPLVHPCLFVDFHVLERSMHETKHNCVIICLDSEPVVSNVLSQYVLRNNKRKAESFQKGRRGLLPYGQAETSERLLASSSNATGNFEIPGSL